MSEIFFVLLDKNAKNMRKETCPKCNSTNINYNFQFKAWSCYDCNAIFVFYNQEIGCIPCGQGDFSPNIKMPSSSSLNNSSKEEL